MDYISGANCLVVEEIGNLKGFNTNLWICDKFLFYTPSFYWCVILANLEIIRHGILVSRSKSFVWIETFDFNQVLSTMHFVKYLVGISSIPCRAMPIHVERCLSGNDKSHITGNPFKKIFLSFTFCIFSKWVSDKLNSSSVGDHISFLELNLFKLFH